MIKKTSGLILILLGVLSLIIGFIYHVGLAGIPYQDPTPELTEKYMHYQSIGYTFYKIGFFALN